MVSDKDIYISANVLIEQHGAEAENYANDMIENKNGGSLWKRILMAIQALQNRVPDVIN